MKAGKRFVVLIWCLVVAGCAANDVGQPEPTAGAAGWQLWVANADLTAARALPVAAAESPSPAVWSPDGTRLAARSNDFGASDIVVVTPAGSALRRLTDGSGQVTPLFWHPDGERFTYFVRTEDGVIRTFAVSAQTGATSRLLPNETRDHVAVVSPDGTEVLYQSRTSGNFDYVEGFFAGDVVRVQRALHPLLAKRMAIQNTRIGERALAEISADQMVQEST